MKIKHFMRKFNSTKMYYLQFTKQPKYIHNIINILSKCTKLYTHTDKQAICNKYYFSKSISS